MHSCVVKELDRHSKEEQNKRPARGRDRRRSGRLPKNPYPRGIGEAFRMPVGCRLVASACALDAAATELPRVLGPDTGGTS